MGAVGGFFRLALCRRVLHKKVQQAEKLSGIHDFCRFNVVPKKTRRKIRHYYKGMFEFKTNLDEQQILTDLPEVLRCASCPTRVVAVVTNYDIVLIKTICHDNDIVIVFVLYACQFASITNTWLIYINKG